MEIDKIKDWLFNTNPSLSQNSINVYTSTIYNIMIRLKLETLSDFITYINLIIKFINSNYENNHTIKTKLATVIIVLRGLRNEKNRNKIDDIITKINEMISPLSNEIKTQLATHEKSKREKEAWITTTDKTELTQILKSKIPEVIKSPNDLKQFRNYIIFVLYNDLATRLDLADTKILFKSKKKLSDEWNYILIDKVNKSCEYILNVYKTFKTYGSKIIKINDSLYNDLLNYKKVVDRFNKNNYLLLKDDASDKLSRNRLSKIYKNLGADINKKLSVSVNRHIKISELVPVHAMQELSNKMGHSLGEQISVYAKN